MTNPTFRCTRQCFVLLVISRCRCSGLHDNMTQSPTIRAVGPWKEESVGRLQLVGQVWRVSVELKITDDLRAPSLNKNSKSSRGVESGWGEAGIKHDIGGSPSIGDAAERWRSELDSTPTCFPASCLCLFFCHGGFCHGGDEKGFVGGDGGNSLCVCLSVVASFWPSLCLIAALKRADIFLGDDGCKKEIEKFDGRRGGAVLSINLSFERSHPKIK